MRICQQEECTGCGMCVNLCPVGAIKMTVGYHGFRFPVIDGHLCSECGLCKKKCPVNNELTRNDFAPRVYAAWSKNKTVRNNSTSGGVFYLLAEQIAKQTFGSVSGVKWNDMFQPEHCLVDSVDSLALFQGSKYVQSDTGKIYSQIKANLHDGKNVLFSGTPCQNHALRLFLGKPYENLYQVDLVCHGVPAFEMFRKYLDELERKETKEVADVRLRYKNPYWDYSNVRILFKDESYYEKSTTEDPYFTLFNLGYSLRDSCHACKYANTNRTGDITLADFWGYNPKNLKMRDFLKGTSLVIINTKKGQTLFDLIKKDLCYEASNLTLAQKANKCLSSSFTVEHLQGERFWDDYEKGLSIDLLMKKYVSNPYKIPRLLFLRRAKAKYKWILKR